jgi:hypothetical protein
LDFFDKGYSIQQTNKRFKLKMAMKKPTKTDLEAGRVFRCGNCDAFCGGDITIITQSYVMGRPQYVRKTYYCDKACAYKHSRDTLRPGYEKNIKLLKRSEADLKDILQVNIHDTDLKKKKSKTLFQAIKMVRQYKKTLTMLLSGESTLHIMQVEYFKVSEAAMELAELVGEEEDPVFNKLAKEFASLGFMSEYEAQSLAMCARSMAVDHNNSLSLWFN